MDGNGLSALFFYQSDLVFDSKNNIIVTDTGNNRLRVISGDCRQVTTLAGGSKKGKIDGSRFEALFNTPLSLAIDKRGNFWVADLNLGCLRVVQTSLESPKTMVDSFSDILQSDSSNICIHHLID